MQEQLPGDSVTRHYQNGTPLHCWVTLSLPTVGALGDPTYINVTY